MKARLSVPIHISWLSFIHQIGKSHTGCIIKVVLASLLSPVSCASFPNVDDHSGCVLTLINLAAHHDKPGVWWEMAKSAGRECPALNSQGLSASCGDCCHCWSWFSTKVAEETAIPQICHSSKSGFGPEKAPAHKCTEYNVERKDAYLSKPRCHEALQRPRLSPSARRLLRLTWKPFYCRGLVGVWSCSSGTLQTWRGPVVPW